jgi:N-acyl-D-aspartate/D-glutamate deacylase
LARTLTSIGIGTNVGFLVGHGEVRDQVMGKADRAPSQKEQNAMMQLVESAMKEGALGLSSGLYYRPGSFAATGELTELATVVAQYGGLYESHIRDESSYNIGLLAAIQEALDIGRQAGLPVHISHIKALGVDVWGESTSVIAMIEAARKAGGTVTADQYPWRASGTHLDNALVSRWAMAGSDEEFHARLEDPELRPRIVAEMRNNLRIRGGPEALLIATCPQPSMVGKTLAEVANESSQDPIDVALKLLVAGDTRVISFNMNPQDIEAFMVQPWVMTSSDGNDGHPRKYASYPKKYHDYVVKQSIMPVHTFFHRSTGLVADTFGLKNRGYLRPGYFADISIIDPETFSPQADFDRWNRLSTGIDFLFVNGVLAIDKGYGTSALSGRALSRGQ